MALFTVVLFFSGFALNARGLQTQLGGLHRLHGIAHVGFDGLLHLLTLILNAAALRDRATKAGSDQSGHMGAVLAIKDGIVYLGDESAGMAKPLY